MKVKGLDGTAIKQTFLFAASPRQRNYFLLTAETLYEKIQGSPIRKFKNNSTNIANCFYDTKPKISLREANHLIITDIT